MELTSWLSLAMICIFGAMSPGPSLAVVLRYSLYHSAGHGIVAALSHGIGVGIYAAASLLGLAGLIKHFPMVYQGMVYAGAAYLAYMGIRILTSRSGGLKVSKDGADASYTRAAVDGFSIAFLNPKLAIFFLALFSQFINPDKVTLLSGFIMCATVLVIDSLWYFIVSLVTAGAREKFRLDTKAAIIDKVLGAAFVLLAVRVVTL